MKKNKHLGDKPLCDYVDTGRLCLVAEYSDISQETMADLALAVSVLRGRLSRSIIRRESMIKRMWELHRRLHRMTTQTDSPVTWMLCQNGKSRLLALIERCEKGNN